MENPIQPTETVWPLWQRLLFRFFMIYLILEMAPWNLMRFLFRNVDSVAYFPSFVLQNYVFRWHDPPRWKHPPTGSGDTLDDYVLKLAYLILALLGTIIWSVIARKRKHHTKTLAWLRVGARYYLAFFMFIYGTIKLFALQMPYPSLVQFYTPLGNFTPMRFTWMFMGYSFPYQFFGGLMETIGGLMLIWRRSLVSGLLLLAGVLGNVVMLNFFYGVPVKLFSSWLLILTLFLLSGYANSLYRYLWLGKGDAPLDHGYNPTAHWNKWLEIGLKVLFLAFTLGSGLYTSYNRYQSLSSREAFPMAGAFDITSFERSGQVLDSPVDENRWNRMVMDGGWSPGTGVGNILQGTTHLEGVRVTLDSTNMIKLIGRGDKGPLFEGTYETIDSVTYQLEGMAFSDTLRMTWVRRTDQMILPERGFMWVQEQKDF